MIDPLEGKLEAIAVLCREFGVVRLDVFGSAATSAFNPETSDLDFVMTFEDRRLAGYAKRRQRFAESLEQLFSRPVDLIFEDLIRNPYFLAEIVETRMSVNVAPDETAAA